MSPCGLVRVQLHFGRNYRLHLESARLKQGNNQEQTVSNFALEPQVHADCRALTFELQHISEIQQPHNPITNVYNNISM
jgi:hypothetical protein